VVLAATVSSVACVVVVVVLAGGRPYALLGLDDPGALVRLGTPLLRLAADAAGTVCVGALVFASCFAEPGDWSTPVRCAGRWATAWCLAAGALVVLTAADQTGQPLTGPPSSVVVSSPTDRFAQWAALEEPVGWLVTAGLALVVAMACRTVVRRRSAVVLLGLAVLTALPPLATGHSSAGGGHDLATTALLVHVPAAMVWLGVLVALLRPGWRSRAAESHSRYRRLALVCWLVLAASGLVDAAVLVPQGHDVDSAYGRLLAGKIVLVAVLGIAGGVLRGRIGSFRRLAVADLLLLATTVGVSVGLTHLPPPAFLGAQPGIQRTLLGYDLAGPPTPTRLLLDWRIDLLFGPLAVLLAAGYLLAVRRLPGRWPPGRTAAWLTACLVLLLATSSGIGRYAPAMFSAHIAAHMLVAMLVPLLFALGGPFTLADRLVPGLLRGLYDGATLRVLTHPLVILPLFAGSPFVLYGTGLFAAAARFHWAGMVIDTVFLLLGYLFAWTVVGVDPLPRPLPVPARLGVLLAAMPFDVVFGTTVLDSRTVIGDGPASANLYSSLALPWVPDLLADQHLAGLLALLLGEATLLVATVALVVRWPRLDDSTDEVLELASTSTFGLVRLGYGSGRQPIGLVRRAGVGDQESAGRRTPRTDEGAR
jgi:putative copper resistance protein D